MSWRNPPIPWAEFARLANGSSLRSRTPTIATEVGRARQSKRTPEHQPEPAPERQPERAPGRRRPVARRVSRALAFPYAELHCHSNASFLDGASPPEELVEEAVRLGLEALALTDRDGMYGVVRFAEAAKALGMRTVFGAELTLGLESARPTMLDPDPSGDHLLVLVRDPEGYARLCRAISTAQLAGSKGAPRSNLELLAGLHGGHWLVLTGCRKGAVPRALVERGPTAAAYQLDLLIETFGRENVLVEIWDHGDPLDSTRNDALVRIAAGRGIDAMATNNVHYAVPRRRRLATALAAVRARRSLHELDGWLPASASAHLRSGFEQASRLARYPGTVERAAVLGRELAFDLQLIAPKLPDFPVPTGHTEMSWLRHLAEQGAIRRYGPRGAKRVEGAWRQIDYELDMIEDLGYAGYFLIVWDIVRFCERADIYCQGRGSAANSAVCYAIGITKADAVSLGLLFERFLSPERDGPPDIDLDIEAGRREEAIQYVYQRYGRDRAAQVANVITYQPRSAVRDMGRALGYDPGQLDAWAKQIEIWGPGGGRDDVHESPGDRPGPKVGPPAGRLGEADDHDVPAAVMELAAEVQGFPRHLGIHSGGMVICDRPVLEVCPVEWATMKDRSVLQWDKDDCAAIGLVKFDLLGLGMLSALHAAVDLIREHQGVEIDLAELPQEPAVYEMLQAADSVGVFQVESRAQMATLPRLRPRTFYDLVVEVALIRPGPIQGGSVHPYIRRRNGSERVTYLHPLLERSLSKTLGVPLFQEQLMQMAVDVAGFTAAEADQLRQAMSAKRSAERMERLRERLYQGMAERGVTGEVANQLYEQLAAFANFGFPESHAVSFAYLVYSSAWLKLHYPEAFLAALLNSQPMGFYAPRTLVADARRHSVVVRGPDLHASDALATLEPLDGPEEEGKGPTEEQGEGSLGPGKDPAERREGTRSPRKGSARERREEVPGPGAAASAKPAPVAVRVGLSSVRGIGDELAERIAAGRPYDSMADLVHRIGLSEAQVEALATAGAFGCFGLERREALWAAGAVAQARADRLPGAVVGAEAPRLPGMSPVELSAADLWATGLSATGHPVEFLRERLDALGAVSSDGLAAVEPGARVLVGGIVTHRQRPATAGGTTFLSLEDETGIVNVICSPGVWARYRRAARTSVALLARGRLERAEGVTNVIAEQLHQFRTDFVIRSRDFH
ncbi:MAG TPA: error-prone DNA polymerase [Actinomycetes bacterium]